MKFIDLFSGIGGFSLGLERAGMQCVGHVEINPFCQRVLKHHWPHVKLIGDIHDVKADSFGAVGLVCGGVPCQPASCAGKRRGTADDRWLWPEAIRIVREAKPTWILFENVCGLLTLEDGVVFESLLSDLEREGYETQAFIIPACAVDAPHERKRVWIVAHTDSSGFGERRRAEPIQPELNTAERAGQDVAYAEGKRFSNGHDSQLFGSAPGKINTPSGASCDSGELEARRWLPEPGICRIFDAISQRLDGLDIELNPIYIMGIRKVVSNANAEEKRSREVLQGVFETFGAEDNQWKAGGQGGILEKGVLQSVVYGDGVCEGRENAIRVNENSTQAGGGTLRDMRHEEKTSGTPQGQASEEQHGGKHTDALLKLPHEIALERGEGSEVWIMQNLWRAFEEIGYVPKAFSEVQEIWGRLSDEETAWIALRVGTGSPSCAEWPGVQRVSSGVKGRVDRLRSLGNAVVPQVVEEIGRAIMEAEKKTK